MLRSRASAEGASAQVESPHNPERAQSPTGAQAPKARANSSVTVTTENRTLPPKDARAPKAQAKEFSHTINKGRGAVPPPRERRRRKRPGRKPS